MAGMYIIVAGAGLIGREITKRLLENRHDVVVIDIDRAVCETVQTETGAMTIHGSATDIRVLDDAGATKADVLITLMRNDADNIACALLGKSLRIPRIVSRLRIPRYEEAYRLAGVTSIVRVADLLLGQIMTEVEQAKVKRLFVLGGGKAELFALTIPEGARASGMTIREIASDDGFPGECIFTGIYRGNGDDFLIPRGDAVLREGDTVFLVSSGTHIKRATDFLTRRKS